MVREPGWDSADRDQLLRARTIDMWDHSERMARLEILRACAAGFLALTALTIFGWF